jgi:hypothetical protein
MTKSKKRPTIAKPEAADPSSAPAVPGPGPGLDTSLPTPSSDPAPAPAPTAPPKRATTRGAGAKRGKHGKLSISAHGTAAASEDGTALAPKEGLQIANIILHLKCSMADLTTYNEEIGKQLTNPLAYNPSVPPDIMTYNHGKHYAELSNTAPYQESDFAYVESKRAREGAPSAAAYFPEPVDASTAQEPTSPETAQEATGHHAPTEMKDIHLKLKKLKVSLFKNMAYMDKKSACFWCTYDFDNTECYIPKYEMDDTIHGYGSFCRPECAAAYLMKENLDDSTKFERYHLLNHIYGKLYDYKRNIKPAPNPYYMLDKYYGNMTIQEYRKLLKSDHLLLVIDKPLTRVLPELHEENEEFLTNIYGTNSTLGTATKPKPATPIGTANYGVYKVRRQSDKVAGPNKSNLVKEHFGLK